MMLTTLVIFSVILSYLIGSIPTAVWVGKAFFGIDVRNYGSGNAGATNTFRVLGKRAGIAVMAVDIFKGWTATSLAILILATTNMYQENLVDYQLMFGFAAVLGHIFPIYVNFKGGKGVATLLGMVLAIHPLAALACTGVFLLVLFLSKYVSLGSMLAALAFPIFLFMPMFNLHEPLLNVFGVLIFLAVALTHQKNIKRIINGEENKAKIKIRRKKSRF